MTDLTTRILAAPNAQAAAELALLATDWTQLPNSSLTSDCVTAFSTYRNAVRVIRRDNDAINNQPSDYTWPTLPDEVWS
tara:strand:- start:459 stop:695 length:237 start_codon:yes stop_codon:yes gene_type:complete